ncbi:MAG: T9SS type A sorting domain-containing protein, partial [Hymenobacter sp.]
VVVGPATVQRAIDARLNAGLGYRHYAAPVSNSTVGDLATSGFAPVVNPAYNTMSAPTQALPFPTVLGYDDSRLGLPNAMSGFDKGFFSPASPVENLAVGRGYTVNIGAGELVDFQGTLTNGDQPLTLSSTRPTYPDGGWQLLGNPYPAPLDYSLVSAADRAGLEDAVYVYSSTSQYAGRYRAYVNGVGDPVLPVGQAYFARVAAGLSTATMTFRNSQRLTAPSATTMQRTAAETRPLVQLTLQGVGSPLLDEATVYFEPGATSGFEPAFDAEKLSNPTGLNLSISQGSRQLSIDGQAELGASPRVVPLAVRVPAAGSYTLTASQVLNLGAVPVYLRDWQLGTLTDLRQQPSYQFAVANAAALSTTRFELVFSPQQPLAAVPTALARQVAVYPNPAKQQVTIDLPASLSYQPTAMFLADALGRVVRQQVLPAGPVTHTLPLANVAPGVYFLHLTTELGAVVQKLVIE